jgi:hypothetical protein
MMQLLVGRPAFKDAGSQVFKYSRRAISSANLTIEHNKDASRFENRPANKDLVFGTVSRCRYNFLIFRSILVLVVSDAAEESVDSAKRSCSGTHARMFHHYDARLYSLFAFLVICCRRSSTDFVGPHADDRMDKRSKMGKTQDCSLSRLED